MVGNKPNQCRSARGVLTHTPALQTANRTAPTATAFRTKPKPVAMGSMSPFMREVYRKDPS